MLHRSFTIATDLKLCNILFGLMSHSSMHPCCWGDSDKYNLDKRGNQRTFGSLEKLFWSFYDARVDKKKAKEYGNAIHPSMITGNESMPLLEIVPPPELHLLLGPVNTLYNELEKVWKDSHIWLAACNVKRSEYHGGHLRAMSVGNF